MTIDDLKSVVPPPAEPVRVGGESEWAALQERLGLRLPRDLFDFARAYGSGQFGNPDILVYNPFDPRYLPNVHGLLGDLQDYKDAGIEVPYRWYPKKRGLFPWGTDSNGFYMYWLTRGHPEEWPIVVQQARSGYWSEPYDMRLAEFLVKVFTNEFYYGGSDVLFEGEDLTFRPDRQTS